MLLHLCLQTLSTGGFPFSSLLTRWMSETLCRQWRSRSFCVWRTSKINPGTSGRNMHTLVSQVLLCRQWWTRTIQVCNIAILSIINCHLLSNQWMYCHPEKKGRTLILNEHLSYFNNIDFFRNFKDAKVQTVGLSATWPAPHSLVVLQRHRRSERRRFTGRSRLVTR